MRVISSVPWVLPDWCSLPDLTGWRTGRSGETMVRIARGKVDVDSLSLVARGILCNVLVCLAVWLCMAARSVTDKVLAIVFPITAFVTCGLKHSVANMYFLPLGAALTAGSASFLHRAVGDSLQPSRWSRSATSSAERCW
ncbi:MAG: formate/nitrite transporter family protein [Nitrospiraceae bacterium]